MTAELAQRLLGGDRRALAQAITLVESTRPDDRARAAALLPRILDKTGRAHRIGVSGAPGAGKSTFLNAFGLHLVEQGRRIAVLAVDPSSGRSGGSILGDKTRMPDLAARAEAFIRPSPAGRTLGGVARRTREALLLCEAAGCDVVIVETIGVGQSEAAVAELVDSFLLLVAPGGGDDLQGIKRGVMELADAVAVTKADGELAAPARRLAADLRQALALLRPRHAGWAPPVLLTSAHAGAGIAEVAATLADHRAALESGSQLERLRAAQAVAAMWAEVRDRLADAVRAAAGEEAERLVREVSEGRLAPGEAAARITDRLLGGNSS